MTRSIADLFPPAAEAGVGLALRDETGRYLFFLAGTRHRCPPGELFYAGFGGHREEGEDWLASAHREALEEAGTDVELLSAPETWYILQGRPARKVEVSDQSRPLALYEMIAPRDGSMYRIVVYQARLQGPPRNLPEDEVWPIIAQHMGPVSAKHFVQAKRPIAGSPVRSNGTSRPSWSLFRSLALRAGALHLFPVSRVVVLHIQGAQATPERRTTSGPAFGARPRGLRGPVPVPSWNPPRPLTPQPGPFGAKRLPPVRPSAIIEAQGKSPGW